MANKWVRDGTITNMVDTEIDLRSVRGYMGEYDWITIKGRTDKRSEELCERLLRLLNEEDTPDAN